MTKGLIAEGEREFLQRVLCVERLQLLKKVEMYYWSKKYFWL